jgi:hypothetical protein
LPHSFSVAIRYRRKPYVVSPGGPSWTGNANGPLITVALEHCAHDG